MKSGAELLFIISALPVFLIGMYIYKKDLQKEPTKLLVKLFLGGIGACFLVLAIDIVIRLTMPVATFDEARKLGFFPLLIYVFIGVALLEEFSKYIFLYKLSYKDSEFDELYDGIVYGVFVALGFAFFENLFYVFSLGFVTGVFRGIFAVPGHACDGALMGYYLGLAKYHSLYDDQKLERRNIFLSLLIPTISHGIYDFSISTKNGYFYIFFLVFVICMYIYILKKIKEISSIRRKMKYNDNFCPNCGIKVESNFCPYCGRKNE